MNGELSNLDTYASPEGIVVDFNALGILRSNGYPIDGVKATHSVERTHSNKSHWVVKVETTTKPRDDPELDIVADKINVWLCDCGDFTYDKCPDLGEFGNDPSDAGDCVHIERVKE
jgi:hypothetical protein